MKRKKTLAVVGMTCAIGVGSVGVVQAQRDAEPEELPTGYTVQPLGGEQTIDIGDVPPQVLHTADQAAKTADLTNAQVDFDDIEAVYEITGEGIEIDVKTNGKLEEIEENLGSRREAREAIPRPVRQLLRRQLPGFSPEDFERSTRPTEVGLLRVFYEFDGTRDGEELDVEVNQRGTVYTVEPASLQRPAPGTEVPEGE
jgi:hypothetical protein